MEGGQCAFCGRAQAKFLCSCSTPAIPICPQCLAEHVDTEGVHTSLPIEKKPPPVKPEIGQGNEVCDECKARAPARFCFCVTPARKFCEECDLSHYQKARHLTHSIHPMSAFQAVASGRVSVEAFRKKQLYINDLQNHMDEELVQFDAFVMRTENEFDGLISHIAAKKEEILRDLQTLRIKLEGHIISVQQIIGIKRYTESFEVKTLLDDYILNGCSKSQSFPEQIFVGNLKLQQVKDLLKYTVSYELHGNRLFAGLATDIAVIKGNSLQTYNSRTLQCTSFTLLQRTNINHGTAVCFIGDDVVLCCGGEGHNDVYEVNIRTGNTLKVANTNWARRYMGLWSYNGVCVYAFGGYDGKQRLNTSEQYIIERKTWMTLSSPLRKAKSKCSVCEHSTGLYISGRDNSSSSLEHFNPFYETFRLIQTDSIDCQSILLCAGDQLYLIRKNTIEGASLAEGPEGVLLAVVKTVPQMGNGMYWLCQPTVRSGQELVGLLNIDSRPCGLFSFDTAKVQFTHVAEFTY